MYRVHTIVGTVRVPPNMFSMGKKEAVLSILREKYERKMDPNIGVVLSVHNIQNIEGGYVVLGDGAAYYDVTFDVLAFYPDTNEVVECEVTEVVEFGAFLSLGPMEGLVHLSQVTDDVVRLDRKSNQLIGKNTKRTLKKGDVVKARIITASIKPTILDTKVGLSMRTPGLGKEEWSKVVKGAKGKKSEDVPKKEAGKSE
ncbi:MAG: DNA-directed RNA polymerase [Candidatus Micrarchaeia archaeon]